MRVVWIKVGGVWPLNTGGRLRTFELLSALSATHEITLVTTHGPDDDAGALGAHLPNLADVISIPYTVPKQGSARFALTLARSWTSREPVDLWRWRVPAVEHAAAEQLASGQWDAVVADFLVAAPNVPRTAVPVVYFAHNVEHQIWRRLASIETQPLRRAVLELEWRKVRRREARMVREAAMTIAVSDADKARLQTDAPDARIGVIATGVDTDYFRPRPGRTMRKRLVFCGSMDWYPNEDAVVDFAIHVWPRIKARHPDASFCVVGRRPSARVRELARAGRFDVTGTVPDVRPFVAAADVCVVPLRVGGGTRIKIFEALAMARPVVSTTIGAEGLGLIDGTHYIAADDHGAFVSAIDRVFESDDLRARLATEGRALVETRYAWPQIAAQFSSLLERAGRPAPALALPLTTPAAS